MTAAPDSRELVDYVAAARRMLARGGYELSGQIVQAERWGISHIQDYLETHSHPERRSTVHIAGSKAKGSTAIMTEALLRAALPVSDGSARTMLYTSPDLHSARERIVLEGKVISAGRFAALADDLLADPMTEGWSYFELLTVMAWQAAEEAACRWQVVEVGLGGRLDTTNAILEKAVSVITPIDREHTAILGHKISEIAAEKAGILTGPCDVVVAPQRASAIDVIRAVAEKAEVRVHEVAEECALRITSQTVDQVQFDLRTPKRTYRKLKLGVMGAHQVENAAAAVRAAELALESEQQELQEEIVRHALSIVRLPGRGEVIGRDPLMIADGAHTPLAAKRLKQSLDNSGVAKGRVFVLGFLEGKEMKDIARPLFDSQDQALVTLPRSARAVDLADAVDEVASLGIPIKTAPDVETAMTRATLMAGEKGVVVITGSMRTVAEAREVKLFVTGDRALGLR